jgi:alpha,alpha-trehalase
MERAGDTADADQVANAFMKTVSGSFDREGTIHEKYNVLSSSADVQVMAGYKTNVIGFGWTNGVYLVFEQLVATSSMAHTDSR